MRITAHDGTDRRRERIGHDQREVMRRRPRHRVRRRAAARRLRSGAGARAALKRGLPAIAARPRCVPAAAPRARDAGAAPRRTRARPARAAVGHPRRSQRGARSTSAGSRDGSHESRPRVSARARAGRARRRRRCEVGVLSLPRAGADRTGGGRGSRARHCADASDAGVRAGEGDGTVPNRRRRLRGEAGSLRQRLRSAVPSRRSPIGRMRTTIERSPTPRAGSASSRSPISSSICGCVPKRMIARPSSRASTDCAVDRCHRVRRSGSVSSFRGRARCTREESSSGSRRSPSRVAHSRTRSRPIR